jgi:transglutaminase-like putative cysteine protease
LAAELTKDAATVDEKIAAIYNFVVENFTYDYELAESVQTGYLPMLDEVLSRRKGICFDYSALVTAMLRSQGIPARLEIGYHGEEYHAWISKFCDIEGWIEHRYHYNGEEWYRMDPTVESGEHSAHRSRTEAREDDTYILMFIY